MDSRLNFNLPNANPSPSVRDPEYYMTERIEVNDTPKAGRSDKRNRIWLRVMLLKVQI